MPEFDAGLIISVQGGNEFANLLNAITEPLEKLNDKLEQAGTHIDTFLQKFRGEGIDQAARNITHMAQAVKSLGEVNVRRADADSISAFATAITSVGAVAIDTSKIDTLVNAIGILSRTADSIQPRSLARLQGLLEISRIAKIEAPDTAKMQEVAAGILTLVNALRGVDPNVAGTINKLSVGIKNLYSIFNTRTPSQAEISTALGTVLAADNLADQMVKLNNSDAAASDAAKFATSIDKFFDLIGKSLTEIPPDTAMQNAQQLAQNLVHLVTPLKDLGEIKSAKSLQPVISAIEQFAEAMQKISTGPALDAESTARMLEMASHLADVLRQFDKIQSPKNLAFIHEGVDGILKALPKLHEVGVVIGNTDFDYRRITLFSAWVAIVMTMFNAVRPASNLAAIDDAVGGVLRVLPTIQKIGVEIREGSFEYGRVTLFAGWLSLVFSLFDRIKRPENLHVLPGAVDGLLRIVMEVQKVDNIKINLTNLASITGMAVWLALVLRQFDKIKRPETLHILPAATKTLFEAIKNIQKLSIKFDKQLLLSLVGLALFANRLSAAFQQFDKIKRPENLEAVASAMRALTRVLKILPEVSKPLTPSVLKPWQGSLGGDLAGMFKTIGKAVASLPNVDVERVKAFASIMSALGRLFENLPSFKITDKEFSSTAHLDDFFKELADGLRELAKIKMPNNIAQLVGGLGELSKLKNIDFSNLTVINNNMKVTTGWFGKLLNAAKSFSSTFVRIMSAPTRLMQSIALKLIGPFVKLIPGMFQRILSNVARGLSMVTGRLSSGISTFASTLLSLQVKLIKFDLFIVKTAAKLFVPVIKAFQVFAKAGGQLGTLALSAGRKVGSLIVEGIQTGLKALKIGGDMFLSLTKSARSAALNIANSFDVVGRRMMEMSRTLIQSGQAMLNSPLSASRLLRSEGLSIATDFEAVIKQVEVLGGVSKDQIGGVTDFLLQLGADSVFSATQSAEAFLELAKSGLSVEDSMKALPPIMDLAAAGGIEIADSASIVVAAVGSFGKTFDDTTAIVDSFAAAANVSTAEVSDLATAFGYAAPQAAALHLSVDDLNAMIALLTDRGIEASRAGTALRALFSSMANPTDKAYKSMVRINQALKENSEAADLNLSIYTDAGKLRSIDDYAAALAFATEHAEELGISEAELNEIFGDIGGSANAVAALRVLGSTTEDGTATWIKYRDAMSGSASAQEIGAALMDTFAGSIEALQGSLETLYIKALTPLIKYGLRPLTDMLTVAVNFMSALPEPVLAAASAFVALLSVVVTLTGTFSVVAGVVLGPLGAGFSSVAGILVAMVSPLKVIAFLLAGGGMFATAALALTAIVAAGAGAYRFIEEFKNALDSGNIAAPVERLKDAIKRVGVELGQVVRPFKRLSGLVFNVLFGSDEEEKKTRAKFYAVRKIVDGVATFIDMLADRIQDVRDLGYAFNQFFDLLNARKYVGEDIQKRWHRLFNFVKDNKLFEAMIGKDFTLKQLRDFFDAFYKKMLSFRSTLATLGGAFTTLFSDIFSMDTSVLDAFSKFFNTIADAVDWNAVASLIASGLRTVGNLVGDVLVFGLNTFISFVDDIPWADVWDLVVSGFKASFGLLADVVEVGFSAIGKFVDDVDWAVFWTTMKSNAKLALSALLDVLEIGISTFAKVYSDIDWGEVWGVVKSGVSAGLEGLGELTVVGITKFVDMADDVDWSALWKQVKDGASAALNAGIELVEVGWSDLMDLRVDLFEWFTANKPTVEKSIHDAIMNIWNGIGKIGVSLIGVINPSFDKEAALLEWSDVGAQISDALSSLFTSALGTLLGEDDDQISAKLQEVTDTITGFLDDTWTALEPYVNAFGDQIAILWTSIKEAFASLGELNIEGLLTSDAADGIKNLGIALGAILAVVADVGLASINAWAKAIPHFVDLINALISGDFSGAAEAVVKAQIAMFKGFFDILAQIPIFKEVLESVKTTYYKTIAELADAVVVLIKPLQASADLVGVHVFDGLLDSLRTVRNDARIAAGEVEDAEGKVVEMVEIASKPLAPAINIAEQLGVTPQALEDSRTAVEDAVTLVEDVFSAVRINPEQTFANIGDMWKIGNEFAAFATTIQQAGGIIDPGQVSSLSEAINMLNSLDPVDRQALINDSDLAYLQTVLANAEQQAATTSKTIDNIGEAMLEVSGTQWTTPPIFTEQLPVADLAPTQYADAMSDVIDQSEALVAAIDVDWGAVASTTSENTPLIVSNMKDMQTGFADALTSLSSLHSNIALRVPAMKSIVETHIGLAITKLQEFRTASTDTATTLDETSGAIQTTLPTLQTTVVTAFDVMRTAAYLLNQELSGVANGITNIAGAGVGIGAASTPPPGRAEGGDVRKNKLYEVAEGGKSELLRMGERTYLIPGSNGTVVPPQAGFGGQSTAGVTGAKMGTNLSDPAYLNAESSRHIEAMTAHTEIVLVDIYNAIQDFMSMFENAANFFADKFDNLASTIASSGGGGGGGGYTSTTAGDPAAAAAALGAGAATTAIADAVGGYMDDWWGNVDAEHPLGDKIRVPTDPTANVYEPDVVGIGGKKPQPKAAGDDRTHPLAGGRAYGGGTKAFSRYRINELYPEVYQQGRNNYLLTGSGSGRVSPIKDAADLYSRMGVGSGMPAHNGSNTVTYQEGDVSISIDGGQFNTEEIMQKVRDVVRDERSKGQKNVKQLLKQAGRV